MIDIEEILMKKDIISSKNICLFLGVVFGLLIDYSLFYFIPSIMLFTISGIQTFELSQKKKKYFEDFLNHKLDKYEDSLKDLKKDCDKNRTDLDSLKMRQNISGAYNKNI